MDQAPGGQQGHDDMGEVDSFSKQLILKSNFGDGLPGSGLDKISENLNYSYTMITSQSVSRLLLFSGGLLAGLLALASWAEPIRLTRSQGLC